MVEQGSRGKYGNAEIYKEVAELLDSGYALTHDDLRDIGIKHGKSPHYGGQLGSSIGAGGFTQTTGILVKRVRFNPKVPGYGSRIIYYDARLEEKDTDIEFVREKIRTNLSTR